MEIQKTYYWIDNKKNWFLIFLLLLPLFLYLIPLDWIFSNKGTMCIFKNITGKECLGCGMTRAIFSLLYLDFKEAYYYNKLVVIVAPVLVYIWVRYIFKGIKGIKNNTTSGKL